MIQRNWWIRASSQIENAKNVKHQKAEIRIIGF